MSSSWDHVSWPIRHDFFKLQLRTLHWIWKPGRNPITFPFSLSLQGSILKNNWEPPAVQYKCLRPQCQTLAQMPNSLLRSPQSVGNKGEAMNPGCVCVWGAVCCQFPSICQRKGTGTNVPWRELTAQCGRKETGVLLLLISPPELGTFIVNLLCWLKFAV